MFASTSSQSISAFLQHDGPNATDFGPDPYSSAAFSTYAEPEFSQTEIQSATKQKKQPSLVVIACRQCRARKVRCDSIRPKCGNCTRRATDCEFDTVPKRRGPDRVPGTRHRSCKKRPTAPDNQGSAQSTQSAQATRSGVVEEREGDGPQAKKRKRVPPNNTTALEQPSRNLQKTNGRTYRPSVRDEEEPSLADTVREAFLLTDEDPSFDHSSAPVPWRTQSLTPPSHSSASQYHLLDDQFDIINTLPSITSDFFTVGRSTDLSNLTGSTPIVINSGPFFSGSPQSYIPRGPSMEFAKQTWWDNLLDCYSEDPHHSAKKIMQDLHFLFHNTVFWISFIHVPNFFDALNDPIQRLSIQPSFVLAALAIASFMKASEIGTGQQGRNFSLWLRDAAQSALDSSLSVNWVDSGLAQASYLLAMYEAGSHPDYAPNRVVSAIRLMDGLIRTFGLTYLDAAEPTVSLFPANAMPLVSTAQSQSPVNRSYPSTHHIYPSATNPTPNVLSHPLAPGPQLASIQHRVSIISLDDGVQMSRCGCGEFRAAPASNAVPSIDRSGRSQFLMFSRPEPEEPLRKFFSNTGTDDFRGVFTDWPDHWTPTETKREEDRRLCWSALTLICNVSELTTCFHGIPFDLFLAHQENYALFFPGEYLCKTTTMKPHKPKESVWALHCRTTLLWFACQRFKDRVNHNGGGHLVEQAWNELEEINKAQNWHTCLPGGGLLFLGKEQINNLRMVISNSFSRFVPLAFSETFTQDCAEGWLSYRNSIVQHVRKSVQFISKFGTRTAAVALAKRPLSIWWAMFQVRAGLEVWRADHNLTLALSQSLDFLALTDFLSTMWPCNAQFMLYTQLRKELIDACITSGISIPQAVPIPGVIGNEPGSGWMTPSPALCVKKADPPNDIPILGVD